MRRSRPRSRATLRLISAVLALGGAGAFGCSTGNVSTPDAPAATPVVSPPAVGPAPLRRLTDDEYLNALHDLFPALNPTLPPLPADIPVAGFDNAASAQAASDVLVARYESIANLYAQAATADTAAVSALVGCSDWSSAALATTCAAQFVAQTGRRIFRRPLDGGEQDRFMLRFGAWQSAVDFEGAVQLTLSAMLQAPQFVYRAEPLPKDAPLGSIVPVEPYAMASRLSFFLWESVPDDALLEAAANDALHTEDQLRAQAERMLADDRARRLFWSFPRQWLGLDQILLDEGAARTPQVDPAWTTATQASAAEETELFVENVLAQGGTLRDLLTSRRAWVDGEMSRVYGLAAPGDPTAWSEVALPAAERAGLITRVAFLAGYSHRGATSPPVRGNAIELRFLCQLPVSPPPGADLSQPVPTPGEGPQTNRMLFETRTSPPLCQGCHAGLNGFGFGLENYDAAGHYQTIDDGLPIDASGVINGTDVDGPYVGGVALSGALSRSRVVHDCATEEMVRYALGRPPAQGEFAAVQALSAAFMQSGGDLRALVTSIVTSETFSMRIVEED